MGDKSDLNLTPSNETYWDIFLVVVKSRVMKSLAIILLVILLLAAAAYGVWYARENHLLSRFFQPTSITITVIDELDMKPIAGANVSIGGLSTATNRNGEVHFDTIGLGSHHVYVESASYLAKNKEILVANGFNTTTIVLTPEPQKINFIGAIYDYVTDKGIPNASVETKHGVAWTDSGGRFNLQKLEQGDVLNATFSGEGFHTKTETIEISLSQKLEFNLTPIGKAYYVTTDSNYRRLYQCNYDGTENKALVEPIAGTEDYEANVNPTLNYVAFLSTRDQRKMANSEEYYPTLFTVKTSDQSLFVVTQEFGTDSINWSSDGRYLAWRNNWAFGSASKDLYIFEPESGQKKKINQTGESVENYVFNHNGSALAWSGTRMNQDSGLSEYFLNIYNLEESKNIEVTTEKTWQFYFSDSDNSLIFKRIYIENELSQTEYLRYNIEDDKIYKHTTDDIDPVVKILSPNLTEYAYVLRNKGHSNLYVSDREGLHETQLTESNTVVGTPLWDPSGNYLIFNSQKPDESALYIISRNGGNPKKIVDENITQNW